MAGHHQGKTGGHCGAGYAATGHPAKPGFDRNADCGHCFAAFILCSPDGAGVYPAAAGRGNRRCKAKRRSFRPKTHGAAHGFLCAPQKVARPENIRQSGCEAVGDHPQHLFAVGEGTQRMKKYSLLSTWYL